MRILAIDPGSEQSAWLVLADGKPENFAIEPNEDLVVDMREGMLGFPVADVVVIEQMQSYGMPVGREVFDAVFWSGRFAEAVQPVPTQLLSRKAVAGHLCGTARAKDQNVRAALIERFGGEASIRKGGPLYRISKDVWSALAIAVTHEETGGSR